MKKKPDMGRWFGVEEIPLGRVRYHVAELIPCITLGDDAFSHGHRDITTIGLLRDIEEEFVHIEKRLLYGFKAAKQSFLSLDPGL
jgi:hypothetical protein